MPDPTTKQENYLFWKNLILVVVFLTLTPLTLLTSLFSLLSFKNVDSTKEVLQASAKNYLSTSGVRVYASLPTYTSSISEEIETGDARVEIVKQYLEKYNSPMTSHEAKIVETADKYGLDFRLITAIAQQESNLCKIIPPETYNCWGWGIHSEGTLGFNSFEEGIETVSAGLKKNYIDKGYTTVEEIMNKYTPMSNGSWANGVNTFMAEMQ